MKDFFCTLLLTLTLLNGNSQDLFPFRSDSLWGYKDKLGAVKIEPQFQYATKFMGKVAIAAKNDKFGAIDKNNNQVIPFRYEYLRPLDTTEFLFGYRAKYFGEHIMGVMTNEEKIIIPAEFSYITKYKNTYRVTKKKDSIIGLLGNNDVRSVIKTYGLYDINGKVLIPCKYDYISWINDTLIDVSSGGLGTKHALFTNLGKQLTGFDFMVFGKFIEGMAKTRIGDKYGFIFPTGEIAIPIIFDYCLDFNNGYAIIKQGEKWGAINRDGKVIVEPKFEYQEVETKLQEKYGR